MMFVDSSVWIDFFNGVETPQAVRLRDVHLEDDLIVGDLVLVEVLQGFSTDKDVQNALRLLSNYDLETIGGPRLAIAAAANFRHLRGKGITIRKTIDTLIATWCIRNDCALLHRDRDFQPFVVHLGLRTVATYN